MIVRIDEEFYIEITTYNHILHQEFDTVDKEGEPKRSKRTLGFYSSVQQCLRRVVREKLIREEEDVTLGGYIVLLEEAVADLAYLLEEHLELEEELL